MRELGGTAKEPEGGPPGRGGVLKWLLLLWVLVHRLVCTFGLLARQCMGLRKLPKRGSVQAPDMFMCMCVCGGHVQLIVDFTYYQPLCWSPVFV